MDYPGSSFNSRQAFIVARRVVGSGNAAVLQILNPTEVLVLPFARYDWSMIFHHTFLEWYPQMHGTFWSPLKSESFYSKGYWQRSDAIDLFQVL